MGLPLGYGVHVYEQRASRPRKIYTAGFTTPDGVSQYVGTYGTQIQAVRVAKRAARRHARKAARS